MTIFWTRRALRHLVAVREYIASDSPHHAGRLAAQILQAVELLAGQRGMGRPGRILGTRELIVAGTPFLISIPYLVRGTRVELIAIFHGRPKWPSNL